MQDKVYLKFIGSQIKKTRTDKKMTQQSLSKLCGFEKSSLSRIESGQINVTVLTLKKISKSLKVPVRKFFK
ncbi:MAG: helix-turn-helix transcriptional regulator [Bacteroidetes bacterium]|nr:helix-turn-helix transcriptional regulator [Bacteroidota bacterium]MBP6401612.1 helix-turn-helix transcriptional regulator [Bacteroidia bacterium]MBK6838255.1 helix-turn-helix transcriptional regulator [Bacteroidota bacterium]MBK9526452.1 helix-turn-helix transcriptional regulator [Bacteroidota bacterium]MBK9543972.1 helix-turn-helix transcriptional regulator [Bacteroidota bacterium]